MATGAPAREDEDPGRVAVNGVKLRYELSGVAPLLADPRPVVLLHELGGSLATWDDIVPHLQWRFRTLRYDHRGAGGSDPVREGFALEAMADDLEALLDRLGLSRPCILIGCAVGVAVAMIFAARRPDRVERLVACGPATAIPPERRAYLAARADQVAREGMAATVEDSLGKSYPPEIRQDEARFEAYRARYLTNDPESYAWINRAMIGMDLTAVLPAIKCPVLLVAGTHDKLRPPAEVRRVAALIPGAQVVELDGGHVLPVQAADELVPLLFHFLEPA